MDPVKILAQIQKLDDEVLQIDSEGNELREKIKDLDVEVSELEVDLEMESETVKELETGIKTAEDGIRENQERIEKDEVRLSDIKNDKEYAALTREIENAKKAITVHEMEVLSFTEKFEEASGPVKEKEELLSSKQAELETVKSEFADKESGMNTRIDERKSEIEKFLGDLKPLAARHYTTLKERRGPKVVVPVLDEVCQGCYINIPPQTYIELQKETGEIMTCPHCHRILAYPTDANIDNASTE